MHPDDVEHDAEHFADTTRDAVAFAEAMRSGDGRGTYVITEHTDCLECLVERLGDIAWRLGDPAAIQAAAASALQDLHVQIGEIAGEVGI